MANLITFFRLMLVFVISAIAFYAQPKWQLLNVPFVILNILLDGLDGVVARSRHETSVFGAVFDIAADRIIEFTLWIVLTELGMISVWVTIIFITRGVLVDALRKPHTNSGHTPFSIMKTPLGKFLVAGRTMRFTIGLFKLLTFSWLFFLLPLPEIYPQLLIDNFELFSVISDVLVYTTLIICLARGIPVLVEAWVCKN
jgi:CDP-diacylglycerol--glycerol-3-phosphate 3-phosphatidyltransferase